jgi:hypothetical protein
MTTMTKRNRNAVASTFLFLASPKQGASLPAIIWA